MKVYDSQHIRNVVLLGHSNSGKTTLTAGILYGTGVTTRLTQVEEGNTLTDYDEEEVQRKISITTGLAAVEYNNHKFNFLDTPGFPLFNADTRSVLAAADCALMVVEGVEGVQPQTERFMGYAREFELPTAFLINKLDKERANFDERLSQLQEVFGREAVAVQMPIGSEKDFRGVIDLICMRAYLFEPNGKGIGKMTEIPSELQARAQELHEAIVEMVAEEDEELMEEFFSAGTVCAENLTAGLREAVHSCKLYPVLCASAYLNIGTSEVLATLGDYMPSPAQRPARTLSIQGQEAERPMSDDQPPAVFVFKTLADIFAGRISCFKVMSGTVKNDQTLFNQQTSAAERFSHLSCLTGKTLTEVPELHAGDIGAVSKLKDTLTGHTLSEKNAGVIYPPVKLPEPQIAFAIAANSRQDEDRMGAAIARILEEDPCLRFYRDPQTQQFLLAGSGQQHVEIVVSKLARRYGVNVTLKEPQVPYRETIRGFADVQGRHKKQTGGHGQFGDCKIKMEPLERGQEFEFVNAIFGGAIPKTYIPAVEKGILEAAAQGYLAGFPVVDFKVTLYDGSYHDVDSSEMAFKLAGRKAFKAAMATAKPALLEPIMNVQITAPQEYAGDIMGDLNSRRGRVAGMEMKGSSQVINASVPMSEMLTYQNALTSITQGRANFTMEFDHYDFMPQMEAEKVIAKAKAARTGVEEEEE
ncbi:MAG: elongation factor G [Bryobacterales bacterium]|nr:elongation factor G [Bryobacterales bacterium]